MSKAGDTITCHDVEDMLDTMKELAKMDIETDWDPGDLEDDHYVLHVISVQEGNET